MRLPEVGEKAFREEIFRYEEEKKILTGMDRKLCRSVIFAANMLIVGYPNSVGVKYPENKCHPQKKEI